MAERFSRPPLLASSLSPNLLTDGCSMPLVNDPG